MTAQLSYLALCICYEHQVINVQVPFLFKLAIDWLAALGGAEASLASFTETNATLLALFASPAAVLIGYGIARSGVSACTGKHLFLYVISCSPPSPQDTCTKHPPTHPKKTLKLIRACK
jgi:hypothetical protein